MSKDESAVATVPEAVGRREAERSRPMLLLGSFAAHGPRMVPVDQSPIIGRGQPANDGAGEEIVSLPDKLLSRRHLRVSGRQGGYDVEDLGSLNGSYLDGRRLIEPTTLSEGSILLFGNQAAVFRRVSAAEASALAEEAASPFGPVATRSPSLALALGKLRRLARTDDELLLVGETGVGKSLYAQAIHRASGRGGPFVTVNCAALSVELIESELFGCAPRARGKAAKAKARLIDAAEGGTLFLDEIGDLPPASQGKIFRFLSDRQVVPPGAATCRRADVRVLAASSRLGAGDRLDPARSDLVARLGAAPIRIPPLRERPEDVGPLAAHFAAGAGAGGAVEPAAFRALCLYGWPLNVRELEKAVKHAAALSTDKQIRLEQLPDTIRNALSQGAPIEPRRRRRPAPARVELEHLLRQHHGNVSSVARSLDRKWTVVWRWLSRHDLRPELFRQ
jgi:DNA-binding NtrC family response regulator